MFDKIFIVEEIKADIGLLRTRLSYAMAKEKIVSIKKIDDAYQTISSAVEGADRKYAAFIDIYWNMSERAGVDLATSIRKRMPSVKLVAYSRLDVMDIDLIRSHFDAWIDKRSASSRADPEALTLADVNADFLEKLASGKEPFFTATGKDGPTHETKTSIHSYTFKCVENRKVFAQFLVGDFSKFSLKDDDLQLNRFQNLQDSVSASLHEYPVSGQLTIVALPTGDGVAIGTMDDDTDCHALKMAFSLLEHLRKHGLSEELRVGVHYGPIYHLRGEKGEAQLIGPGLNKAARVQSAGHPGKILVSQEYFSLFLDRAGERYRRELNLEKMKEYKVKDEKFHALFVHKGGVRADSKTFTPPA